MGVPEGWSLKPVRDLGEIIAGKAKDKRAEGDSRPYLRVANVFDGRIDIADVYSMPFSQSDFERYRLRDGDVLLNEGQSLDLVGRCSIYRGEYPGPCAIQNALIRFRAGNECLADFAQHLFRWCQATGIFASIATQTTSIAHLGVSRFSNLEVGVPPLAEQRKIAAILSSVDEAIEKTQAVIDQVQVVKKGLMQELLTRGLPGRHKKFKQTEIGEIPETWEVVKIVDVADVAYGISAAVSKNTDPTIGWPILTGANLTLDGGLDTASKVYIEPPTKASFVLQRGDLLLNWRSGSPQHVGKTALFELDGDWTYASFILRIRCGPRFLPEFGHLLLNYMRSCDYFSRDLSVQVNFKMNAAVFREVEIPCPSVVEQQEICRQISILGRRMEAESGYLKALSATKQALMSVLLTGELRVPP